LSYTSQGRVEFEKREKLGENTGRQRSGKRRLRSGIFFPAAGNDITSSIIGAAVTFEV